MIYFPGTINTMSTRYIITLWQVYCHFLGYARQLTLCMLVALSREGVVFFVFLSPSHFTEIHVLPPPVSGANWRSLFRPGGPFPIPPKMASSYTGSAHSPFPGRNTIRIRKIFVPHIICKCKVSPEMEHTFCIFSVWAKLRSLYFHCMVNSFRVFSLWVKIYCAYYQYTDNFIKCTVRYHSGGSMELNARILLLPYMVYLWNRKR